MERIDTPSSSGNFVTLYWMGIEKYTDFGKCSLQINKNQAFNEYNLESIKWVIQQVRYSQNDLS